MNDILVSHAISDVNTPLHFISPVVDTKSIEDDLDSIVRSSFVTSSVVTGDKTFSCGPTCGLSNVNGSDA